MKIAKYLVIIFVLCFIFMPSDVSARTLNKQCTYNINSDETDNGISSVNCTLIYNTGLFGSFTVFCQAGDGSRPILIGNDDSTVGRNDSDGEDGEGFNLKDWFGDHNACPRYLVVDSSRTSVEDAGYAANTTAQVEAIKEEFGDGFVTYTEQNASPESSGGSSYEQIEGPNIEEGEITCPSLFNVDDPGSIGWLLQTILNYIKVIGPILVVILSAIDFIKAITSSDDKAMKEAQTKLIIRLIAALALFLVPTLVQVLLSFISDSVCMPIS